MIFSATNLFTWVGTLVMLGWNLPPAMTLSSASFVMFYLIRRLSFLGMLLIPALSSSAEPLHRQVDQLILARSKGKPVSKPADDAEFLRRIYLDLTGSVPTVKAAREFLADQKPNKRAALVEELLSRPTYARRMTDFFHLMWMERLGDHTDWRQYLHDSFTKNRPWDQMACDILAATSETSPKGASFFLSKRLENYGQNPVDYPGLARDIGRLFLGKDLRCAQCHDHLFIKEYRQADFQGLFVFVQNAVLQDAASAKVGEKPLLSKIEFNSVFGKTKFTTGPRVPGGKEIVIPTYKKGEEYLKPPDRRTRFAGVPKFSPLAELAREVPASPDFARNMVNRLWWMMMGRGLVHPLDLHHKDNPSSQPEVLDLLAKEFVSHKYDIKWLLRELALTDTYQRTSELPAGVTRLEPERFLTASEKGLSAEQLLLAVLTATGEYQRLTDASNAKPATGKGKPPTSPLDQLRTQFVKAFSGPVREPEEEFSPSLKGALFLLNDAAIGNLLTPRPGNLVDRLSKLKEPTDVAEELYLSVLTRRPEKEEIAEVQGALSGKTDAERIKVLTRFAWALLASTEFAVNH